VDTNAEKIAEQMKTMFGESIVDPDVYPKIFAYQAKLASYELKLKETNENSNG
jgi:hypothetical protein